MRKLISIILLLIFPLWVIGQIQITGTGQGNTYTITNLHDGKSIKASGLILYVGNPYYEFDTATDGDTSPSLDNYPVIKLNNTNNTVVTDLVITDSTKTALILLFITSDSTEIDNDAGQIECHTDLQLRNGDLVWAFRTGSDWYIIPFFLKDDKS